LLVEYGFAYSATREVARHMDQPERLRQIVAEVMGGKLLLCVIAAAVSVILWLVIPAFRASPLLLIGALWIAVAQGLSPLWYFQGIERMRLPAVLDVLFRLLFVVSVFLWIKSPDDAASVLIFQAASITLSLLISLRLMYRQVSAGLCSLTRAWAMLKDAWHFFLFVAVVNVYAKANSFILGLMADSGVGQLLWRA
jgi:PST family polysaccharide transporter